MIRLAAIAAAALLLAGCQKQAESTTQVGHEFKVDTLFTVDGCTVYRFVDGVRPRYFTNCRGSTEWSESCGKNCTHDDGVTGGAR
ncbi:DUF4884 domain-containing protein [Pseudomonas phage Dolphis]|nr:DUF4884 domain-containing protein [Pseudomonas phage Dolphis]